MSKVASLPAFLVEADLELPHDVISIDPGGHTGVFTYYGNRLKPSGYAFVTKGYVPTFSGLLWSWKKELNRSGVILVEDVVGQGPRTKDVTATLKKVGAVEMWAEEHGFRCYVRAPQCRLAFRDRALELVGLKKATKIQEHAVDALSHALAWGWEMSRV